MDNRYGKRKIRIKRSAGVACCRYNDKNKRYEVLLVKKRYTYNFTAFVMGQYKSGDVNYIRMLFNGMTYSEKIDILSLQYDKMWYRITLRNMSSVILDNKPDDGLDIREYLKKKKKFTNQFALDGGLKLHTLMNDTNHIETIWEVPKGRRDHNEMTLDCAVREFSEETRYKSSKYDIFPHIPPYVESYTNTGIKYINVYFLAESNTITTPRISFNAKDQVSEISDIRWIGLNDIRVFNQSVHLYNTVSHIFKVFKKIRRRRCNNKFE